MSGSSDHNYQVLLNDYWNYKTTVSATWKGPNHDVNHSTRVATAFNLKDKAEKQSVTDRKQCIPIENKVMGQLRWDLFWSSLLSLIDNFGWTLSRGGYCSCCRGCRCKGRRYKGCRECRGRELKAALIWNAGMRKSWCELAGKKYGKLTSAKIYGYRNGKAGVKGANGVHTLAYKDVTASALSTDSWANA